MPRERSELTLTTVSPRILVPCKPETRHLRAFTRLCSHDEEGLEPPWFDCSFLHSSGFDVPRPSVCRLSCRSCSPQNSLRSKSISSLSFLPVNLDYIAASNSSLSEDRPLLTSLPSPSHRLLAQRSCLRCAFACCPRFRRIPALKAISPPHLYLPWPTSPLLAAAATSQRPLVVPRSLALRARTNKPAASRDDTPTTNGESLPLCCGSFARAIVQHPLFARPRRPRCGLESKEVAPARALVIRPDREGVRLNRGIDEQSRRSRGTARRRRRRQPGVRRRSIQIKA